MVSRTTKASRKLGKVRTVLTVTHHNAAGIDIGSSSHFVAVPPDRAECYDPRIPGVFCPSLLRAA